MGEINHTKFQSMNKLDQIKFETKLLLKILRNRYIRNQKRTRTKGTVQKDYDQNAWKNIFLSKYWEKAKKVRLPVAANFTDFYRDFEWMGVQRHIKVLGIFARLCHRDGKNNYLIDMPLVINYLRETCERYSELNFLLVLLDELEIGRQEIEIGYDS